MWIEVHWTHINSGTNIRPYTNRMKWNVLAIVEYIVQGARGNDIPRRYTLYTCGLCIYISRPLSMLMHCVRMDALQTSIGRWLTAVRIYIFPGWAAISLSLSFCSTVRIVYNYVCIRVYSKKRYFSLAVLLWRQSSIQPLLTTNKNSTRQKAAGGRWNGFKGCWSSAYVSIWHCFLRNAFITMTIIMRIL